MEATASTLQMDVSVENLTGHKFPTAYPSRRAWLHVVVRDRGGRTVFESGALNADGSIQGNDNDENAARFEPHYREIKSSDEVQIYEPILKDADGHVTTGLSNAVGYLKDNRLLPRAFKNRARKKISPSRATRWTIPISLTRAMWSGIRCHSVTRKDHFKSMWSFCINPSVFDGRTIWARTTRRRLADSSAITIPAPKKPLLCWLTLPRHAERVIGHKRRGVAFARFHKQFDGCSTLDSSACADAFAVQRRGGAGEIELARQRPALQKPINKSGVKNIARAGGIRGLHAKCWSVNQPRAVPGEHSILSQRCGRKAAAESALQRGQRVC